MVRPKRTSERLVALFVLGVVLMFPPILGVFNQQVRVFGVPLLYLYLFIAWAALILLTAAVVRGVSDEVPGESINTDTREALDPAEGKGDA